MSLRVRLAIAIALVAALMTMLASVAVYNRERTDRIDRARRVAAADARNYAIQYEGGIAPPNDTAIVETTGESAIIPEALRARVQQGYVATAFTTLAGTPYVIAGAPLQKTTGRVYAVESFGRDAAALTSLRRTLITVDALAALAGAMTGIGVALYLAGPLRRTAAIARRIAEGDLDARIRPRGDDEIAQVGRALDEMADSLGAKIRELDAAAQREQRFSADVAHELRTPVTGMVAAASLLGDSPEAAMVRSRAHALGALIEDLLEVMRLEGASEHIDVDSFDLVRLVRDVARDRAPSARIEAPASLVVRSDPRRVERVLANLLDNAVRHGGGDVEISLAATPEHAEVAVRDHGSGFGEFLEHAGERFAMKASARGGGTGLGLAIARGQARLLGGELAISDDPEGGAVVRLRLPADGES